jgi:hypothetical protein
VCVCVCSQHLKAADEAVADKAAAEKAAAAKAAADKAAAAKAAADKAAKAAAAKAAAEELALGLLPYLTTANIADDVTLKKSIAFCDKQGVTSVSDLVEYNLVDDFVRHLDLKNVPGQKLRSMLQATPGQSAAAAAAKAQQEAKDVAAALAASLAVSGPVPPPPSPSQAGRVKRWGDGLEAPAAGARNFVPQGFEVTLDVPKAIARFGHSASHVTQIMDAGRAKASTSPTRSTLLTQLPSTRTRSRPHFTRRSTTRCARLTPQAHRPTPS